MSTTLLDSTQQAQIIASDVEKASELLKKAKKEIGQKIYGQEKVIEQTLTTLLAGGHALLVGVPGLGKSRLVETIGTVCGLHSHRVQFTPDLMPSDILGSEVLEEDNQKQRHFRYIKGPIFSQLFMADEINRASPRTQSALLQAMQEHEVSIGGKSYPLMDPFHVLATQNPIEQEGTYPLPEAQLDRFLMEIELTYPSVETEQKIISQTTGNIDAELHCVVTQEDLIFMQKLVRKLPLGTDVRDMILRIVRNTRPEQSEFKEIKQNVAWGAGPRASQSLVLATKAYALINGRLSPSLDDVYALALPILRHRVALNFAAQSNGWTFERILSLLLDS